MANDIDLNDPDLRKTAMEAAMGRRPFDHLIENARLLDLVTGRERLVDIGLVGAMIASVHRPDANAKAERRTDVAQTHVMPGFIDTHMHVESSMVTPSAYSDFVLTRGVTSIIWDPHEFANVSGISGIDYALQAANQTDLRILTLAPTCVPSAPGYEVSGADFDGETLAHLLERDDVHGSAELMTMQPLLNGDARVSAIVAAALASGKRVCGHGRGLAERELAAYAAAGVETDHELTSADDLIARLEAGMTVELRGSHEHLLPEFAKAIKALGHMPQTLTLCTDDVFPDDLVNRGALDRVMRILIAEGVPALWVYQAATVNAANRIGRPDLGLIAPGKRADLVVLSDLDDVRVADVWMNGQQVVQERRIVESSKPLTVAPELLHSVKTEAFHASDFHIAANGISARVATLLKPRFPEWGERVLSIRDGVLALPDDMIRMAVVNRHGAKTPVRVALLEKWGAWRGAYASTISHDSHNLTVFGRDPVDMAVAANAVRDMDGGIAVVRDGKLVASLALPIAGLVSESPLEAVAANLATIRREMDAIVEWHPPYLVFKAMFGASLVCNKGPRLSDVGIVDVFESKILETCILELDPA